MMCKVLSETGKSLFILYFTPRSSKRRVKEHKDSFQFAIKHADLCPFYLTYIFNFFVRFPASLLKQFENFCQVVRFLPGLIFGITSAAQHSAPAKNWFL